MALKLTKTPQPPFKAPKVPQTKGFSNPSQDPYAIAIYKALTAQQQPAPQPGLAPASPPPFDPIYENAVSGINRTYGDTSAQINYDESQLSPTYGYQTDTAGNVTVDPSNPFSKAALLQRTYNQGQAGTTNRMASQGQLYSGATQNALDAGTFQNQSATDALKRAYGQAVEGISQRRRVAGTNQSIQTTGAQGDAIQRALANRPDPATVPSDPTQDPYARAIYTALSQPKKAPSKIVYPTPKVPKGKTPIRRPTEGLAKPGRGGVY